MYVDLHCDTIMNNIGVDRKKDLYENDYGSVDLRSLIEEEVKAQFFAIFLFNEEYLDKPKLDFVDDMDYVEKCISYLERMEDSYGDEIAIARNFEDYRRNLEEGKVNIFITIEDGRLIRSTDDLLKLNDMGISHIGLLWNYENSLGYPNSKDSEIMNKGLKDLGKDVVQLMNERKMIVDVSHLSDGGFWDVHDISSRPFMASHSNARALTPHQRNLTDEMIRAISEKGGIIGLNLSPNFLGEKAFGTVSRKSDYLRHLKHIYNVGGEDVVAIGTDFDGIRGNLEIREPRDVNRFLSDLSKEGFSERVIEKIAYKNFERFYEEVCRP